MRYCLVQLGCQMNLSDAERIRSVLEQIGYAPTEREEEADLLGIVACSVRQKAIDKVYSKIQKWNKWKNSRNLLTFVSGCILPADREKFLKRFDLLFQINELPELPEILRQYGIVTPLSRRTGEDGPLPAKDRTESTARIPLTVPTLPGRARGQRVSIGGLKEKSSDFWKIAPSYSSAFEAFVPIQNGCDKFCTFCAVPYTRGREVSRSSEEILSEVRGLVEAGYCSITLLGQNVNSYGLDRHGTEISFARLLELIGRYGEQSGKRFWVYFTSPHPRDMTEEVLQVIARYDCLAKQIHLPIQSGDDKVLIKMNRNYRLDHYRTVVSNIRRILPAATLFTDIIVGFSGESEAQFEATRDAMREFRYNMAYIAMYSPRPGAASSRWDDDVTHEEKKRRYHELSAELQATSSEHNRRLIGSRVTVLVQGKDRKEGYLTGKTEGLLTVRFPSSEDRLAGQFVEVEITSCAPLSLSGRLMSADETAAVGVL